MGITDCQPETRASQVAHMSRLECVRETLRLALDFLAAFGGSGAWEPWFSRYRERNAHELRNASVERLRLTLEQAGRDAQDILARTQALGNTVVRSEPIVLLQRVFVEQFELTSDIAPQQRKAAPPGTVRPPVQPARSARNVPESRKPNSSAKSIVKG